MYLWRTTRLALLSLILLYLTNLSESSDSTPAKNPTSQNPTSTPSSPSVVKTSSNSGTSSSQPTPTPSTPSEPKKDDKSESDKDDKPKSERKAVMVAMDYENSTDEFEFSKIDKTMTYTAKEGYGFNEVKWLRSKGHIMRADRNVWKTGNPSNLAHKVIVKDLGYLKYDIHIHLFDNKGLHVYHREAWGSMWSYTGGIVKTEELEPQKAENIPSTEHPKEISVVLKGQTEAKDSEEPNNSDPNYSVHKYHVKSRILFFQYEFRNDHECTELKFEDKSVWTHDPTKANQGHPKSAFVFLNTKTVFLYFKDDVILVSGLEGDEWKSVFEGKPETSAVDIKSKASGAGFDFLKDDKTKVSTYTAKGKYLINTVKTKELVLWTTEKLNQYATKVEIQGAGNSRKTLILHLLNGNTKNFNKSGDNQPWIEYGQSSHTFDQLSPSNVKIITKTDNSEGKENDPSQYELNEEDGKFFTYKFNDNAKCVEIKYDDESVWKHDQNDNKDHPKALYFHRGFRFFFFEISEESYRLYRRTKTDDNNYSWLCYSLNKIDPEFDKQLVISYANGKNVEFSKDKSEVRKFGFAFEINTKEGVKFVELRYFDKCYLKDDPGRQQANSKKIYDHENSKYKNNNVITIYLLDDQDHIVVFDKFYFVFIEESKKGTKGQTGDGTGSNPSGGSTPTGGSTPSGGGGTTPESGGTTTTNPASAT